MCVFEFILLLRYFNGQNGRKNPVFIHFGAPWSGSYSQPRARLERRLAKPPPPCAPTAPWQVQRHPGFPWTLLYRLHPRLLQPTHRFQLQLLLRRLPRYLLGRSSSANVNCRPPGSFSPHALWKSAMLCPITKSEILHAEAHPLGHSSSRRRVALHLHLHLLLLLQRQEAVEHPVPDDANIHVALARVRDFARQVAVPLGRVLREAWDGGAGVHELHMVPPRLERRCPRRTQACSPSISLGSSFAYFTSSEIKLRRGSRRGRRHREQTRLHPS